MLELWAAAGWKLGNEGTVPSFPNFLTWWRMNCLHVAPNTLRKSGQSAGRNIWDSLGRSIISIGSTFLILPIENDLLDDPIHCGRAFVQHFDASSMLLPWKVGRGGEGDPDVYPCPIEPPHPFERADLLD